MSIAEILNEVERLSAAERAEFIKILNEMVARDNQHMSDPQGEQQISEAQGDQQMSAAEDEKPFKTIFDVAPHLVGAIKNGLPRDLATNKKYLEGFGTKEAERDAILEREQNSHR